MRSMLKFLCVVAMLQVSTPLMHGMNVDIELADVEADEETSLVGNSSMYGEKVKKHWPTTGFQKVKRSLCNPRAFVCGFSTLLIGGVIGVFCYSMFYTADVPACPNILWDRNGFGCSDGSFVSRNRHWFRAQDFIWAEINCQREVMGGCVPVCDDKEDQRFFMTGWSGGKAVECRELDELPSYVFCSQESANDVEKDFDERGISYCAIKTKDGSGVGLIIPHSHLQDAVNLTAYNELIVGHVEDMEKGSCKSFADEARRRQGCTGPFAYQDVSKNTKKKTPPKHKTRKRWRQ